MSEKNLDQQKKEAAAKAKEEALKRLAERKKQNDENEQAITSSAYAEDIKMKALKNMESAGEEEEKAKALAVAKAKAAALAKQKAQAVEKGESATADDEEKAKAKAKAVAAAKAKAAALARQKAQAAEKGESATADDEEKAKAKAKAIAAAKAKAAALAKQKAQKIVAEESEQEIAPNQALLDEYVKKIEELIGKDVLEEAYINRLSKNVATIVAKREFYFKIAECLKYNELLYFDNLVELHGTDFVTHIEVYVYLYSHIRNQSVVLKVNLDREQPVIPSLVPLWEGANWPECEAYDLLGIQFENHPNLKRILLGEEWVGYPLRKDYEPFDVEV